MPKPKPHHIDVKVTSDQIQYLKNKMEQLAARNRSWGIDPTDYKTLYQYLAVQKITYQYDDELYEGLVPVDQHQTGKTEELLDAYLIVDLGDEIQLKLFQFKYNEKYEQGISTNLLYAFVDRMNRVFLRGDLQDAATLEAYAKVRAALERARGANKRAKTTIQCYYIVNGQNVSATDASKIEDIRAAYSHDRQSYGFTFETYGALDMYNLCSIGRIPIQEETLELEHNKGPDPILFQDIGTNPNGMPVKVLVGFVNVNQLIRLVDRYSNNELFEKNVRLFLGTGKEVNKKIIETITSNQSAWFGFMNNGVSITAENVVVDLPASKQKVRIMLNGMQIINGCQTVNALYHAKYDPELKDRFQGNSNVLVRIYQVDAASTEFLDALIIATNAQNAIRPEDLLSNDNIQKTLQRIYQQYGISYERKEGERSLPSSLATFSKEQAAMAYLGIYLGQTSKLRNSMSRREFFREGEDYYKAFNLREDSNDPLGPLPDDFDPGVRANARALEILSARCLEEYCRTAVKKLPAPDARGPLRKGAYYLARVIYLGNQNAINELASRASREERTSKIAKEFSQSVTEVANKSFTYSKNLFVDQLSLYLKEKKGNEDAALKNSSFAQQLDQAALKN